MKILENTAMLIVAVYVDDLLIIGPDGDSLIEFKSQMMKEFIMIDLGLMTYFLGMEILQLGEEVWLHQTKYAKDLLKKFNMSACKVVATPLASGNKFCKEDGSAAIDDSIYRSLIGSLLYLAATRLDLMCATCLLSRFM